MVPKLYMVAGSAPVRGVLMTAKHIGLVLENKPLDLTNGEHRTPEYAEINPQQKVPALDDNGFILSDSHAIIPYLVDKYARDDSLYPKDLQKRAVINERLHFDSAILFSRFVGILNPILREGKRPAEEQIVALAEAYDVLELFLKKGKYMAGDTLTIADFSIAPTLSSAEMFQPLDASRWPKLVRWLKTMEEVPVYEVNKEGFTFLQSVVKERLQTSA